MSDYSKMMMRSLGGACVMNNLAMARELGVVEMLLDSSKSVTSQEVADKLDLKERYVREMLGALAVGEVIAVDETSKLFHVPDENKSTLGAVSVFCRFVPCQGERYTAVKECYRKSGPEGVRYSDYPMVFGILEEVLLSVKTDIINVDILPFIPDAEKKLESGIDVAEFGCSGGILLNQLAARFPKSTFLGGDVAMDELNKARILAGSQNLKNVQYEVHDLEILPESFNDKFDWIFVRDVIHDLPYPQKALNEFYRIVKPGGILSVIDVGLSGEVAKEVGDPFSMFYYSGSSMFCLCESYQRPDSEALGAAWGISLAQEMFQKAGFAILKQSVSKFDPKELHYVLQK